MKAVLVILGVLMILATAEARPRWGGGGDRGGRGGFPGNPGGGFPGNNGGRGAPVICTATDNGWEEHRAHSNCGECTAAHGTCTERCTQDEYRCQIQGVVQDRNGNNQAQIFYGRGANRWDAEEQAMRDCQWNRATSCTVKTCENNSQLISQRACN